MEYSKTVPFEGHGSKALDVDRVRLNRMTCVKFVWRTELQFRNGESAWLLPTKISNFTDVYKLVGSLPCEHAEVKV